MTTVDKHLDALLDTPAAERLERFQALALETRVMLVEHLQEIEELDQLDELFRRLSPGDLAELLHELDFECCREIFAIAGPELRLEVMQWLHQHRETNDLQAALSTVSAKEMVAFLETLPEAERRTVFNLADGELQVDVLILLQHQEASADFRQLLDNVDPADIADLLESLSDEDRDAVFKVLGKADQADALVELEGPIASDVMEDMDDVELAALAGLMAPDEIVELFNDLDDDSRTPAILARLPDDLREEVANLLRYEEDSAGEIMTPETCSMSGSVTVDDARRALRQVESDDPIHYVYVTAPEDESLIGVVSLMDIITAAPEARLRDVCREHPVYTTPDEDQEDVARKFRKYDLWVMPVVDSDRKLIGRITVDDVMDVVQEEADEDLARMVGAPDIEDEEDSPIRITGKRLPWLMITMFAGLVNSVIIRNMMEVTTIDSIAIFVPAILAMGGNTGMQSSAVCIRGIALGMEKYRHLRQIVLREIMVGLCLGIACGLTSGLVVAGVLRAFGSSPGGIPPLQLGLVVGLSMLNAMAFASCFGTLTPVILHRLGADPAVASGPFVTTSNDLSASLIYFLTCVLLLSRFTT